MADKYRKLVDSDAVGRLDRRDIEAAVRAVHVLAAEGNQWVVQTLGGQRIQERFDSKKQALAYAIEIGSRRKALVMVHPRRGKVERIDPAQTTTTALAA